MQDYLSDLYKRLSGKMKLGLERSRALMEHLDHPEHAFPSVHVAGTNGKGSVTAVTASLLEACGMRVGRFTSPHLVDFSERITINGKAIPEDVVKTYLKTWEPYLEEIKASFFEVTCALAFAYFRDEKVDAAVVETGLGGRLDATGVLHPRVSVITSIGYDHMDILGNTLPEIAGEKAGIIKAGVPLVTCPQDPEVTDVFRAHTRELIVVDPQSECRDVRLSADHMYFRMIKRGISCRTPLIGRHQLANILMAVRAAELFTGNMLKKEILQRGLENVSWKGRFERIHRDPDIIFDVAHNPDGIRVLCETLKEVYKDRPVSVVLGILADKQPPKVLTLLKRFARNIWICPVPCERGMDRGQLEVLAEMFPGVRIGESVAQACEEAYGQLSARGVLCVMGSHYIAKELYDWNLRNI